MKRLLGWILGGLIVSCDTIKGVIFKLEAELGKGDSIT